MTLRDIFLSTKGRISRTQFWLGFAFLCFLLFLSPSVCLILPLSIVPAVVGPEAEEVVSIVVMCGISAAWLGIWGWMMAALCGKRLHDSGRSAKGCVALLIPILGWFWILLECGVRPGLPGSNRYGAPPKA